MVAARRSSPSVEFSFDFCIQNPDDRVPSGFCCFSARFGHLRHRMTREQTFPDLLWRDIKWLLPATAVSAASYSQTLSSSGAAIPAASRRPALSAARRPQIPPAPVPAPARSRAVRSPVRRRAAGAAAGAAAARAAA